jgi:1,4-dihydroxy-2-naphthoate octaprenyltransferase
MFRAWIRTVNPMVLVCSSLTFVLGAGIADYFGYTFDGWRYLVGTMIVVMLVAAGEMLYLYIRLVTKGALPFSAKANEVPEKSPSPLALIAVISTLLVASVVSGLKLEGDSPDAGLAILFLIAITLMAVIINGTPALRYSGYGELAQALMIGSMIPAFSFVIQAGKLHPLILPATLPFVLIWMAVTLVFELAGYGSDLSRERHNLLIRLGWQRGILFHHVLLLVACIFWGLTPVFGLAWRLTWPVLFILPSILIQIWLVNRIALGYPPRWLILKTIAIINFILPIYLLASRFWMI